MQWKRFSYIIFIIRTSSQTFCRLTATSFLQRHTSRKELHRWRRTGRGQTPVLFRQTISQGIILQLKIKIKKEERERKKREKQTKPNRANKSAQNKNIPLGLSIRRRKWRENTRTERETTEAVPAFGWRICNTNPAGSLSDLTQNCWLHMDHGRSTQNCPVLWFSDFWAHNV